MEQAFCEKFTTYSPLNGCIIKHSRLTLSHLRSISIRVSSILEKAGEWDAVVQSPQQDQTTRFEDTNHHFTTTINNWEQWDSGAKNLWPPYCNINSKNIHLNSQLLSYQADTKERLRK